MVVFFIVIVLIKNKKIFILNKKDQPHSKVPIVGPLYAVYQLVCLFQHTVPLVLNLLIYNFFFFFLMYMR